MTFLYKTRKTFSKTLFQSHHLTPIQDSTPDPDSNSVPKPETRLPTRFMTSTRKLTPTRDDPTPDFDLGLIKVWFKDRKIVFIISPHV